MTLSNNIHVSHIFIIYECNNVATYLYTVQKSLSCVSSWKCSSSNFSCVHIQLNILVYIVCADNLILYCFLLYYKYDSQVITICFIKVNLYLSEQPLFSPSFKICVQYLWCSDKKIRKFLMFCVYCSIM